MLVRVENKCSWFCTQHVLYVPSGKLSLGYFWLDFFSFFKWVNLANLKTHCLKTVKKCMCFSHLLSCYSNAHSPHQIPTGTFIQQGTLLSPFVIVLGFNVYQHPNTQMQILTDEISHSMWVIWRHLVQSYLGFNVELCYTPGKPMNCVKLVCLLAP